MSKQKTVEHLASRWLARLPASLTEGETRVLQSAIDRRAVSRDALAGAEETRSMGDRLADAIARKGGSWGFILAFVAFLAVWTIGNVWLLGREQFDPYPFVFLNLILSMVAALQAPIIMMSQNRQSERDRIDAAHDYEVNLKAEIEIMALHEKLDELRHEQILAMRQDIAELTQRLARIESRLEPGAATP